MDNINCRRFNIKNFLLWTILVTGTITVLVMFGFIPWDPEGILSGLGYFISN